MLSFDPVKTRCGYCNKKSGDRWLLHLRSCSFLGPMGPNFQFQFIGLHLSEKASLGLHKNIRMGFTCNYQNSSSAHKSTNHFFPEQQHQDVKNNNTRPHRTTDSHARGRWWQVIYKQIFAKKYLQIMSLNSEVCVGTSARRPIFWWLRIVAAGAGHGYFSRGPH